MYLRYFGLREEPFGVTPDPRFLYLSISHREALASLLHGINTGRGFMSLIAGSGMGKTTLLTEVLEQTRSYARSISLFQTQCTRLELLRYMLADSGLEPGGDDVVLMHEQFNDLLLRNDRAGKKFVVVIDEAQNLSEEVLESVRLLSDFETPKRKLMQIILAGQPHFGKTLSRPEQSQLRQRMSIVCRLQALSPREVEEYIETRLRIAGRTAPLFTPDAITAIAERSRGVPRIINTYCFNLLSLAFATQQSMVAASMVDEVTFDLEIDPSTTLAPELQFREHRAPLDHDPSDAAAHGNISSDINDPIHHLGEMSPAEPATNSVKAEPLQEREPMNAPAFEPPHARHTVSPDTFDYDEPYGSGPAAVRATHIDPDLDLVRELRLQQQASPIAVTAGSTRRRAVLQSTFLAAAVVLLLTLAALALVRFREQPTSAERSPVDSLTSESGSGVVSKRKAVRNSAVRSVRKRAAAQEIAEAEKIQADSSTSDSPAEDQFPLRVVNGAKPTNPTPEPLNPLIVGSLPAKPDDPQSRVFDVAFSSPSPSPTVVPDLPTSAPPQGAFVPGKLISKVVPEFPPSAHAIGGEVEMTASINERGEVEHVQIENGLGILSQAAVTAVRRWRYTPFTLDGKPVKATTHISIKFKPVEDKIR